jgi:hypothetical protein
MTSDVVNVPELIGFEYIIWKYVMIDVPRGNNL